MTPERWRQVEALFDELVELPAPEREASLAAACGDDATLRAELESLLAAVDGAGSKIEQVIGAHAQQLSTPALRGQQIGRYRVLDELGEGGMGVVVLAERDDGQYQTRVAIKLLRGLGHDPARSMPDAIARFRDERQILATLEHPNIVRLLDGGSTETGQPYLVMEYVDGVPITRFVAERQLSLTARLELFARVAAAVAFAHQRLIVHRDLKPSNILVTADGTPKLLDFGIAKLLDVEAVREAETRTGRQLLTPEYASPEQVRGDPITTATDIYSLGALLYELCCDAKAQPLDGDNLEALLRTVLSVEPPRPSTIAPPARRRALRGDLDNIILKALHKQPLQRYASVEQLSEDLERHFAGLPIRARTASLGYRLGKFVRRNAVAVGSVVLVVVALTGATLASLEQAKRADAQAADANAQRVLADQQAAAARSQAELAREQARTARDAMRIGAAQRVMQVDGDATTVMLLLRELESPDPEQAFGWLAAVPHFSQPSFVGIARFEGGEQASAAAWSPDGSRVAISWFDAPAQLWSADGQRLVTLGDELAKELAWSPDGRRLVAVAANNAVARVWQADGQLLATLEGHDAIAGPGMRLAWSPDGKRIATAADDKTAAIWSDDGRLLARLDGHTSAVSSVAWSPDGSRLATASRWDRRARIWQSDGTLAASLVGHRGGIHALLWTPDGELLVTASDDHSARAWRADGQVETIFAGHDGPIVALARSPEGDRIALASGDHRASIWRLDGTRELTLSGHRGSLSDLSWSDDGRWIATASDDASTRVWRSDGALIGSIGRPQTSVHLAWRPHASADAPSLLTVASGNAVEAWAPERGLPVPLAGHSQALLAGAWSGDGSRIATASEDHSARVWTRDGATQLVLTGHAGPVRSIAWSDGDTRLLTVSEDHSARVWSSVDGSVLAQLGPLDEPLRAYAWGPWLATGYADGSVRWWDANGEGELHASAHGHTDAVSSLAWSRDGLLASGSWDASARIWKDGELLTSLLGHTRPVQAVAWSSDGSRIASVALDRSARIWRVDGTLVAELRGSDAMDLLAWSPDGTRLVTTGDKQARIWSAEGAALASLRGHTGEIRSIEWSDDGSRLLTASTDGSARLWSTDGLLLATLVHDEALSSASFDPLGDHVLTTSVDHIARVWLIDAAALLRGFWLSTPRCLDVDARQRLLAEPRADSERSEAACLRMQACLQARPERERDAEDKASREGTAERERDAEDKASREGTAERERDAEDIALERCFVALRADRD